MGIDYDSKLVFGWTVKHDKIVKWATENKIEALSESAECCDNEEKHQITKDCNLEFALWIFERDNLIFRFVGASPYYNSSANQYSWYFGIEFPNTIAVSVLPNLAKIIKEDWYPELHSLVEEFGGSGEPTVIATHHVY